MCGRTFFLLSFEGALPTDETLAVSIALITTTVVGMVTEAVSLFIPLLVGLSSSTSSSIIVDELSSSGSW